MKKTLKHILLLLIAVAAPVKAQDVPEGHIVKVADAFLKGYLGDGQHAVSGISTLNINGSGSISLVELTPEGWMLMSHDYSAMPVLAYSMSGGFVIPEADSTDNRYIFISGYSSQLESQTSLKNSEPDPRWDPAYYYQKSSDTKGISATVSPLIKVTWNQGSTWNRFCPADSEGPGGHVYVGCVAVSMAQAMSVFRSPVTGTGISQYYLSKYGTISADFSSATYKWDEMSGNIADDNNALLLYHCAVAVNMDFSPDGSGTHTSAAAATALKQYFFYSQRLTFYNRQNYDTQKWKRMLDSSLVAGDPIIYSGFPTAGSIGHAFNIDGVHSSNYYHLNWGWSGVNDGYYTIDNLKPGGSDFTKEQTAILGIQPYYYPTGVTLSDTIVLLDRQAGKGVARYTVEDEATDNSYTVKLECDSTLNGTVWVPDYYLDGDSVRTARPFVRADGPVDTVTFIISDTHGNLIRSTSLLLLSASLGAADGEPEDAFTVYPVPVTDRFIINLPPAATRISVTNLAGIEVAGLTPDSDRMTLPASGMPPGIYIITISTKSGKHYSRTVVKN